MTHQQIIVAWLIVELRKRGHNASTAAMLGRQKNRSGYGAQLPQGRSQRARSERDDYTT